MNEYLQVQKEGAVGMLDISQHGGQHYYPDHYDLQWNSYPEDSAMQEIIFFQARKIGASQYREQEKYLHRQVYHGQGMDTNAIYQGLCPLSFEDKMTA